MRITMWCIISGMLMISIYGCENKNTSETESLDSPEVVSKVVSKRVLPAVMEKGLKAHDPNGQWASMKTIEFSIQKGENKETHLFNLENRHALIIGEGYNIGFDGSDVWVAPNKEVYTGNARFYHSVYFYFFAMPYVLADPGIKYKALPPQTFLGKKYNGVSITYNDGVGDAPDDEYIAYFNPETNLMEILMYTVTYKGDGPSEKYSVWMYSDWQTINGVSLPKTMTRYKNIDGKLVKQDAERNFLDVKLSAEMPDKNLFVRPAESVIDAG